MALPITFYSEYDGFKEFDKVEIWDDLNQISNGVGSIYQIAESEKGVFAYVALMDGFNRKVNIKKLRHYTQPIKTEGKIMNVSKITISRGLTINTGNFNSMRFDVQMEAELQPQEREELAAKVLTDAVLDELGRQVAASGIDERIIKANLEVLTPVR